MKSSSALARAALVLAALLTAACSQPKQAALPPGTKVLALGDSLTAAHGVTPEQAWPALLDKRTGWVVINAGVSGDTSTAALQRLPALLDDRLREHDEEFAVRALPILRLDVERRLAISKPSYLHDPGAAGSERA